MASNVLAEAAVRIRPDTASFEGETRAGVLGSMKRVAVAVGGIFAAQKIFDFGEQAVQQAALTQKASETVNAQYRGQAAAVQSFADRAAAAFGISREASLTFASSVAVSGRNIGLTTQQTAAMATGYQRLAGTLGSIKGIDPATIFDKLQLAMLGNTRGLKQLGIAFSTTQEKHEALLLGITQDPSKWDAGTKAQVIYGLAMKHLGDFQDQAKRHSNDLFDAQLKLRAEWANMKEELGAALLPTLASVAGFLAKNLPTAFSIVGAAAHATGRLLSDVFGPFIAAGRRVVGFIQVVVNQYNDLRRAGLSLSDAVQATLIDTLERLGVSFHTAQMIVSDTAAVISATVSIVRQYGLTFLELVSPLALVIANHEKLFGFIQDHQELFIALAAGVAAAAVAWGAYTVALALADAAQTVAAASLAALNAVLDANPVVLITLAIIGLVAALVYLYRNNETVRKDLQESWQVIKAVIVEAVSVIREVVTTTADVARAAWSRFGDSIMAVTRAAWGIIKAVIVGDLKIIQGVIDVVLGVLHGNWSQVWKGITEITKGAVGIIVSVIRTLAGLLVTLGGQAIMGLYHGFSSGFSQLVGFAKSIPGRIVSAIGSLTGTLYNAGVNLINGLLHGITSKIGDIKSALGGLTNSLTSWKGPPARDRMLLQSSGQLIMQGFIAGIDSQTPALKAKLSEVTNMIGVHAAATTARGAVAGGAVVINGPVNFHTNADSFAKLQREALNRQALRVGR